MTAAALLDAKVAALAAFDTPTVANAMEMLRISPRQFTGPAIRAITPNGQAVAGIAVTITMKDQWGDKFAHIRPWLEFLEEIERCPSPVIAVFHDDSARPGIQAMIGEGMSRAMRALGAAGVICDGAIRDVVALREMQFPVWAIGSSADRGDLRQHRYQLPVQVGGMLVNPGDVIHADENGALIVPIEHVAEITQAAITVVAKETKLFEVFSSPDFRVAKLYEFYEQALRPGPG